jgi:Asp-tRNA(Asn)/Glu-tRNA(Gln) amidotransferase A subunit family amidase
MSGLTVELVVSRSVRDVAAALEATHGPAPGDPYVAPPPVRPYTDELEADPGALRITVATEPIGARVPVEPAIAAVTREAAKLLEGLGHEVDEEAPAIPEEPFDLIEAFMTRWFAGQTETLAVLGTLLGRELGPDDVEPLTWAMAEEGKRRHSGQYLEAVSQHQAIGRMLGMWFESGHAAHADAGRAAASARQLRRFRSGPAADDLPGFADGGLHGSLERDGQPSHLASPGMVRGWPTHRRSAGGAAGA